MNTLAIVGDVTTRSNEEELLRTIKTIRAELQEDRLIAVLYGESLQEMTQEQLASYGIEVIFFYKHEEGPISYVQFGKQVAQQLAEQSVTAVVFARGKFAKPLAAMIAASFETEIIESVTQLSKQSNEVYIVTSETNNQVLEYEVVSKAIVCLWTNDYIVDDIVGKRASSELVVHTYQIAQLPFISATFERAKRLITPLQKASVIVAGGRGIQTKQAYELLEQLIHVFPNGSLGASGGGIETGLFAKHLLIGQTGETVKPDLYIACGISGANQHIGGMMQAKIVLAINENPNAPIFDWCDYGIVGRVEDVIPKLLKALQSS